MSDKITSIRSLMMALATVIFASALFDALYGFKNLIQPGISLVYNAIGTQLAPNMVTLVVFDFSHCSACCIACIRQRQDFR